MKWDVMTILESVFRVTVIAAATDFETDSKFLSSTAQLY